MSVADLEEYERIKAPWKGGVTRTTLGDETGPRLRIIPWSELSSLPKREPLIKGLLDRGAMSVVYGASNCGKTFLALDLAVHVALGWSWRSHKARQGATLYIAAEGGLGIEERLTAFRNHHRVEAEGVALLVLPSSVDMCGSTLDTDEIIAAAQAILGDDPLELIVVDTLSRVLAGGNENAPDDMGAFVGNCDRLRQATGAHLLVIHHSGKEGDRGARGHSSLRAAADTEIEVTKDESGLISATVRKQRDRRSGDVFMSRLEQVEIGVDEDGEALTSCVVIAADHEQPSKPTKPSAPMPPSARTALNLLRKAIEESGQSMPSGRNVPADRPGVTVDLWRRYCYAGQIAESDDVQSKGRAFRRAADILASRQIIGKWNEWVWLCDR